MFGHRFTVGADQVDLGIVLTVPPSADRFGLGPVVVGQEPGEGFADERLDSTATPAGPGAGPRRFDLSSRFVVLS